MVNLDEGLITVLVALGIVYSQDYAVMCAVEIKVHDVIETPSPDQPSSK
jgi:hypothetical protein